MKKNSKILDLARLSGSKFSIAEEVTVKTVKWLSASSGYKGLHNVKWAIREKPQDNF